MSQDEAAQTPRPLQGLCMGSAKSEIRGLDSVCVWRGELLTSYLAPPLVSEGEGLSFVRLWETMQWLFLTFGIRDSFSDIQSNWEKLVIQTAKWVWMGAVCKRSGFSPHSWRIPSPLSFPLLGLPLMATNSCDPETSSPRHPAGLEVFRGGLGSTPSPGPLGVGQ